MSKSTIVIIIYIIGLIFGALVLNYGVLKQVQKHYWELVDCIILIGLFFTEKMKKNKLIYISI